jgi:hypothetical protein
VTRLKTAFGPATYMALVLGLILLSAEVSEAQNRKRNRKPGPGQELSKDLSQPQLQATPQAPEQFTIKILKVGRNGRALIAFPKSRSPEVGKLYSLGPHVKAQIEETMPADSRSRLIGLSLDFAILKSKRSEPETQTDLRDFMLSALYGWNTGRIEFGPFIEYGFNTQGSYDAKRLIGGGFLDFNFVSNTTEANSIPAFRLSAGAGIEDNSLQPKAASLVSVSPAFVFKWFGLSTNLAMLGLVGYDYKMVKLDSSTTTISGAVGRLGIQSYF